MQWFLPYVPQSHSVLRADDRYVLIHDHKINRFGDLLSWNGGRSQWKAARPHSCGISKAGANLLRYLAEKIPRPHLHSFGGDDPLRFKDRSWLIRMAHYAS